MAYLVLMFYCSGAAVVSEFVEYQSWAERGRFCGLAPGYRPADYAFSNGYGRHAELAEASLPLR